MNIASADQSPLRQLRKTKAFRQEFWIAFSVITLTTITIAAIFWILAHPYGTNTDEARYINRAYRDVAAFEQGGIGELIRVLIQEDRGRPPAWRIITLPFTLLFGVNSTIVRIVSLISLWVSLAFIYLAGRRIAGATAGAFAVAFLAICPIIIGPNMRFYVDYALILSVAAMLYFLFLDWNREEQSPRSWIGLGMALGLGGLAKPTILFIASPVILLAAFLHWRKIIVGPSIASLFKSTGLAIAMMLPLWIFNWKPILGKAFGSGGYVRHALGTERTLGTFIKWLYTVSQSMLGVALTLLALAIIATLAIQLTRKQIHIDVTQKTAIWICLAGGLPMMFLAAIGTNHNVRLINITLLPLGLAIGIIAALTGWTTSRWLAAIATAVMCFQLAIMVSPSGGDSHYQAGDAAAKQLLWGNPTTVMRRNEQMDWSKLREICNQHQINNPMIAYLGGNGGAFNSPQIAYPWVKANEKVQVTWLWEYFRREWDWNDIMAAVDASNVVLVPFNYTPSTTVNNSQLDNQHNAEFIERMKNLPQFQKPIELNMGKFDTVQTLVFLRKPRHPPRSESPIKPTIF